ncbi:RING finger protein 227-like [Pristis pectinata]|uniref:RING finger protein 227-like n=1 Tax=Pristis pectinata TaxID=685728 RepID=UPI00223D76C3|nr:RING finger protein 227-like [Pristis pectinata]
MGSRTLVCRSLGKGTDGLEKDRPVPKRPDKMCGDGECSVCYCPYSRGSRTPRVLPCQHTFCTECLVALISQGDPDVQGDSQLPCPLCRQISLVRWDGRSLPFPVDPGAWEGAQEERPQEAARRSLADAVKRGARRLRKSLLGQRGPRGNALRMDKGDFVLMMSFNLM